MYTLTLKWPSNDVSTLGLFRSYEAAAEMQDRVERWLNEFVRADRRSGLLAPDEYPDDWEGEGMQVWVTSLDTPTRKTLRVMYDEAV